MFITTLGFAVVAFILNSGRNHLFLCKPVINPVAFDYTLTVNAVNDKLPGFDLNSSLLKEFWGNPNASVP